MNEYEMLGGLHQIVDADVNLKMKNWIESHNVNYSLLYPLAAIELGAIKEPPENMENLFKRSVAAFIYAKAIENKKDIFIKKFNTSGFKKYLKSYETELIPCYQNFRFSREINDINPFSKARLMQVGENRYKLTTSLVTDHYREEDVYFYGEDDTVIAAKEREQTFSLHMKFWNRAVLEKNTYEVLSNNIDEELYNCCIAIVEKDINKWNSRVRSTVFDNPNQLARVIAFFYYHAMLKSIFLRIEIDCTEDFIEVGKETIMYFNTEKSIKDIVRITDDLVIPELKECTFRIACDVTNPLCGETGASAVYGPQKGASPAMIKNMDQWLSEFADLTAEKYEKADADYPGTGAAGGLGFAFLAYTNAVLESGIKIILEETKLEDYVKDADIVVTGEGRLDGQTVYGKAPIGVAKIAKKYDKTVVAFSGAVTKDAVACNEHGIDAFFPILRSVQSLQDAMNPENARYNMIATVEQVFRLLHLKVE